MNKIRWAAVWAGLSFLLMCGVTIAIGSWAVAQGKTGLADPWFLFLVPNYLLAVWCLTRWLTLVLEDEVARWRRGENGAGPGT